MANYRARYRGRGVNGRFVTTQLFVRGTTLLEAQEEARQRLTEVQKRLTEREGMEVEQVVCWKVEEHEQKKEKRNAYVD